MRTACPTCGLDTIEVTPLYDEYGSVAWEIGMCCDCDDPTDEQEAALITRFDAEAAFRDGMTLNEIMRREETELVAFDRDGQPRYAGDVEER